MTRRTVTWRHISSARFECQGKLRRFRATGRNRLTAVPGPLESHHDQSGDLLSTSPRGRLGQVSDYCSVAVYLASDASDFMTGQTPYVDGGTTMC